MANPKRASMREGPLAALFRKTEEIDNDGKAQADPEPALAESAARQPHAGPGTAAASASERRAGASHDPRQTGVPHP